MVTIKHYSDPINSDFTEGEYSSVLSYLQHCCYSKEELLDLRFFHGEILGEEIDQSNVSFLDIDNGTIAIVSDKMVPRGGDFWYYVVIAVVAALVAIALAPRPTLPGSRKQQSATNKLGSPTNEPRINERIDDIFGTITKHTPPLWQVPYRIGVDNQETEVLLLCIGRGKYLIEEEKVYDGNTLLLNIENSQFSKYEPNTYPGNGTPSLQIGNDIDEKIGIYRQSNDLNPSELLPPNELANSNLKWELTGSGLSGLLKAVVIPDDFNFTEYFEVGDSISLAGINYFEYDTLVTLYDSSTTAYQFVTYKDPVDLGDDEALNYLITNVTTDTITVTIPLSASTEVTDAWAAMTDYPVPEISYRALNNSVTSFYTFDNTITIGIWYEEIGKVNIVNVTTNNYLILTGKQYEGRLGPFVVPDEAEEIILNFVSSSGFYKMIGNNETSITAIVKIVIDEINEEGLTTGSSTTYSLTYKSNEDGVRKSVFQTKRIVLPYSMSTVSAYRDTIRDKNDDISNVDIITWRDIYSFKSVPGVDFGDVTLAHVVIPSNSQSQLIKERKQNMDVTRLITQYLGEGEFGVTESFATDDFSQILTHISLDPHIGRLTLDNINADGLLILSDQIKNYFNSDEMVRFGYDFDDSNLTYQDMFITVCNVVNCLPYVQDGMYDAFFEGKQDVSGCQITCRNKIIDSESREQVFERQYDGVEVTYRDELTSISETVYLPSDRSALNSDIIELSGCTTQLQAFRFASRVYNKQLYSRLKVSFEVDEFGRNIIPGKRIDSPDSTRFTLREGVKDGYRVYEGEVIEVTGVNVELSEPVTFTEGEDHYIVFTNENGDNSESILCTSVDDLTILLTALPSEPIYDGYSKDRTKYTFASEQLRDSIALIPQTIEFKINDNGDEINTINSINYHPSYYKDDLEFPS
ncbi:MAG: hypothetical protein GY928_01110 [Colwellia sp.]|nr:hypothetical protein [Colwellia sp.]